MGRKDILSQTRSSERALRFARRFLEDEEERRKLICDTGADWDAECHPGISGPPSFCAKEDAIKSSPLQVMSNTDYGKYERLSKRLDAEEEQRKKREEAQALAAREMIQGCSHDHSKERQIYEKPTSEKIDAADRFRAEGNAAFREKNYGLAAVNYRKALLQFDYTFPDTPEEQQRMDSVKLPCHLNLAACKLHQQEYDEVYIQCRLALEMDPNNVKALYRRGLAYLQQDHFEKAKKDLLKAQTVEPVNREVRDALVLLREKIQRYKRRSLKTYKAMLQDTEQPAKSSLPISSAADQPSCTSAVPSSRGVAPPSSAEQEVVQVPAAANGFVGRPASAGVERPSSHSAGDSLSKQRQADSQLEGETGDKAGASSNSSSPEGQQTDSRQATASRERVSDKSCKLSSRSCSPVEKRKEGAQVPGKSLEGGGAEDRRKEGERAGGDRAHLEIPRTSESGFRRLARASGKTTEAATRPLRESPHRFEAERPASGRSSPRPASAGDRLAEKSKSLREGQRNEEVLQKPPDFKSEKTDTRKPEKISKKSAVVEPKTGAGSRLSTHARKEGATPQSDSTAVLGKKSGDPNTRKLKGGCLSPKALKKKTERVGGRGEAPKKRENFKSSSASPQRKLLAVDEGYMSTSSSDRGQTRSKGPGSGNPRGLHSCTVGPPGSKQQVGSTDGSSVQATPRNALTTKKQMLGEALRTGKSKAFEGSRDEKVSSSLSMSSGEAVEAGALPSGHTSEQVELNSGGKCCRCGRGDRQDLTKTEGGARLSRGVWMLVALSVLLSCLLGVLVGLTLARQIPHAESRPRRSHNASGRDGRCVAGQSVQETWDSFRSGPTSFSQMPENSGALPQLVVDGGVLLSGLMAVTCVILAIVMLYCGTSAAGDEDGDEAGRGVPGRSSNWQLESGAWSPSAEQNDCSEGESWGTSRGRAVWGGG